VTAESAQGAAKHAVDDANSDTSSTTSEHTAAVSADQQLWQDLELLMAASDVDCAIFFRELPPASVSVAAFTFNTSGSFAAEGAPPAPM